MANELNPLWVLTGFFVVVYAMFFLLGSLDSIATRVRRWHNVANSDHVLLPRATVAHDLTPKLRHFLPDRPTIYVTAGDGYPLTTGKIYPWAGFIRDALQSGSKIYYIAANADVRDQLALEKAANKLLPKNGSEFHLYFLNPTSVDFDERQLAEIFRTFHVVLVETSNIRAMWLEAYHPAHSTVAYGCEFVPPELAAIDPRYDQYKTIILKLIAERESLKNTAKAA